VAIEARMWIVDLGRAAGAVEASQQAAILVVLDQRLGLLVIDAQALADRGLAVVVALDEPRAVLIADLVALRRVGVDVVDVAGLRHMRRPDRRRMISSSGASM
jgi:hypothetical protein